jgi:hypothetical protein
MCTEVKGHRKRKNKGYHLWSIWTTAWLDATRG